METRNRRKPIAKPGDYLVSIFDELDNEIRQRVYRSSKWKVMRIMQRYNNYVFRHTQQRYSYRVSMIIENSKYGRWTPEKV